tara:strand:- start:1635 stop:2066 length:432 start_codon:yes stop_codon:yes gene_type:complete
MFDSEEESLCLVKLVSGEEIVAMTSSIEDDDIKLVMLNHPCKISTVSNSKGQGLKFDHWMKFTDEFVFTINFDKIIVMNRIYNTQLRFLYKKFVDKYGSQELLRGEYGENRIKMNKSLGLIGKVDDMRSRLESLFDSRSICSN